MIVVALLLLISTVNALPKGAPTSVCEHLTPKHKGIPAQSGNAPYEISAIPQDDHVLVTIKSNLDYPIGGLVLQARMPSGKIGGRFQAIEHNVHTITCDNPDDTITHDDPSPKPLIAVKWTPPQGYEGPVIFNSTIAQNFQTFWIGVRSEPLQIFSGGNRPSTFKTSTIRTSTSPHYNPQEDTTRHVQFDAFYDGCDETKKCFGAPDGCVSAQNCMVATAITVVGDQYQIELKSASAKWAGLGLSSDNMMGDDSVVECVNDGNGIRAYLSWTTPKPNLGAFRVPNNQEGIRLVNHSVIDDTLYCKVLRNAKTRVNNVDFDLINTQYFLLVAAGRRIQENSVAFHDIDYLASASSGYLADTGRVVGASKLLVRLHGAFMLAAWIGTASIGTLLARYYRKTWVGKTICGKDLWFAWHRFFMICTWALTTVAFILIFVFLKGWSGETSNPHAILGCVVTGLCFLQPIGAFFRPHPGTPKRPIFNWLHWFGGNAAHILAIVTIFFAVKLNKADLPDWFDYILAAFVAFHVVMHLVLSILGCASENSSNQRISSFPMKDMGGSGKISDHMVNVDAPYSWTRKLLLSLYVLVCGGFVIALIAVVAIAPKAN
ncbi:hypothetical protein PPYR_00444 [Photinus pyralis]|uniref:DOMON domain-containing protein n=1 Tax=Photinus pyralis TaxID=7054 RepID=A0A1Y1NJQ2_PHOPY|nr:putative ferric-chelate reductase 1 homolog [Photinus pyralis]XP_031350266.1 putative ferric-chelate reductase 1 homolog [Photinus pyralis]XP_031350276.1 putative ferric-chelate reductase 1 homolog [Photinus pyralis]KAB0803474.1 hypothetical protein PPYR_00444 [Photinus pyralis]